jgi:nicotinamide-nucleotide amidase
MPDVVTPEDGTAAALHEALLARGQTVGTAESLTGGALGDLLSSTPGASATYRGGVVTYATELKQSLLGVGDDLVATYGVVSGECARAMAAGCRAATGATYALATTGVAGPDVQEGKPVGTVYVGLSGPDGETVLTMELVGDRRRIQDRACREALSALCGILRGEQPPLG